MDIEPYNDDFKVWIHTISYAYKQLKSFKEKSEYIKVKILGYQGIKYGEEITKGVSSNAYSHWFDKLDLLNNKIETTKYVISEYEAFVNELKKDELLILDCLVNKKISMTDLAKQMETSRTILYTIKEGIVEKWYAFHQKWIATNVAFDKSKLNHE